MSFKDQKEQMIALRKEGKTFEEIAQRYGISKQYVYQIIRDVCRTTTGRENIPLIAKT